MDDNLELRFLEAPWDDCYQLAFFSKSPNGARYVGQPVTMLEVKSGMAIGEPTARLSRTAMQGLFNEMWRNGFRPKDGTGNGGHIEAIQYHLEDMRKLVFGEPRSKGPNNA